MRTNLATPSWRRSLAWSAVNRAAEWSIFGILAWFWLFSEDSTAWRAVSLVMIQLLAALVGIAWYLLHARVEEQWRVALDRYVEQEQVKRLLRVPLCHPNEEIHP